MEAPRVLLVVVLLEPQLGFPLSSLETAPVVRA
jgi:hypothetical protein